MCLEKKSMMPRIANRDITVYKVIKKYKKDGVMHCTTNIMRFPICLGKVIKGVFKNKDSFLKSLFSDTIESGYIHSYESLEIAEIACIDEYECVAECIIPKGTLYWIGDSRDLASRKLKYERIIE